MAVFEQKRAGEGPVAEEYPHGVSVGPIGRLGRYTATHFRVVLDRLAGRCDRTWVLRTEGGERALGRRLGDDRVAVGAGAAT